tara:strand:- start:602 stop:949 length:348 start_codon:yes stop_codon:yes gene_type:complete
MQEEIRKKCDEIRDLLIEKNKSYGNSVFDKGVLFNVDPMYAIQARINDKLNRIKSKETYMSENDLMDLTGYLVLLQVYMDEVDKRMNKTIKSTEPYEDGETPFDYEISSNGKDEA